MKKITPYLFFVLLPWSFCTPLAAADRAPSPASMLKVTESWGLPTLKGANNGIAYVSVQNEGNKPDTLLGASTPLAESAELHTHEMQGDVMSMRAVKSAPLPAGGIMVMQPGGLHIMLMGLKRELKEGDTLPLTLRFEHAGDAMVYIPIYSRAKAMQRATPSLDHSGMAPMNHMEHQH